MRDTRRINTARFSVRTVHVLSIMNIKTVGKAKEFARNWDGKKRLTPTLNVTQRIISEILEFE